MQLPNLQQTTIDLLIIEKDDQEGTLLISEANVRLLGPDESIIWQLLMDKLRGYREKNKILGNGWFCCPIKEIESRLNMTYHVQNRTLSNMQKIGVISLARYGRTAKRYFFLHPEKLAVLTGQYSEERTAATRIT